MLSSVRAAVRNPGSQAIVRRGVIDRQPSGNALDQWRGESTEPYQSGQRRRRCPEAGEVLSGPALILSESQRAGAGHAR